MSETPSLVPPEMPVAPPKTSLWLEVVEATGCSVHAARCLHRGRTSMWFSGFLMGWMAHSAATVLWSDSYGGLDGFVAHLRSPGVWTDSKVPDVLSVAVLAWLIITLFRLHYLWMVEHALRKVVGDKPGILL